MLAQIPRISGIKYVSVIAVAAGGPAEIVFKALRVFSMRKFVCGRKAVIPGKFFLEINVDVLGVVIKRGIVGK